LISTRTRNLSKRHFQNNFIVYFILVIFFVIGIIIGAILINRLSAEEKLKIANYFSWIFKYIGEKNYKSIDIFKLSLFSNVKIVLVIWIIGLIGLGILIIPIILCCKGVAIGFTVGFLVKEFGIKGFMFALSGLLPHYLIIIPGFLAIGSVGLSYSMYRVKSKRNRIYSKDIADYSILILLFFIIVIVGSFVEGFITPYFLNLIRFSL